METNAQDLIGGTYHTLRGSKYSGVYTITEIVQVTDGGWIQFKDGGVISSARREDLFATEAEARAEGKARRKPRTPKTARPLYGDFAMVAMLNGISTDGTGRFIR